LLSPDIVEAILEGRQEPEITLARLMEPFPEEWEGGSGFNHGMRRGRMISHPD